MNDFGLPAKVRPEGQIRVIDLDFLEQCATLIFSRGTSEKQHRAVQNFTESALRLSRKRAQLAELARPWGPPMRFSEAQQHNLHDLSESYFQAVYNTLSKLAAITVVFPQAFPDIPWRSMERFLRHLGQVPEVSQACTVLEEARTYRTHLDHPAGTPVSNWMTTWLPDDRGVVIYHYGKFGRAEECPKEPRPRLLGFP